MAEERATQGVVHCLWHCQEAWPTVPQHLPVTTLKNGRRGEAQTLLSVAMSVGMVHGNLALTCNGPKAWPKRGQPQGVIRCLWHCQGAWPTAPQYLPATTLKMDEEVKCKHCCLWPRQWAQSTVTQHLPAMTPKNGRRSESHVSLPGCRHGGLHCCHEQRGLQLFA